MSEEAPKGGGGGGGGGGEGGGGGQRKGKDGGRDGKEKKKKESIVDLSRFIDREVRVKFQGGREAVGTLKGYDALINLVLDNAVEYLRDPDDAGATSGDKRELGLIVARGTTVTIISPVDGTQPIPNPFLPPN